jgi:ABC-type transporter MlaC component
MNLKSIAAILLIVAVPVCVQAQKPTPAKVTKADAQKIIKIIKDDKAKTQIYCDSVKLGEQIEPADQKDTKKNRPSVSANG